MANLKNFVLDNPSYFITKFGKIFIISKIKIYIHNIRK